MNQILYEIKWLILLIKITVEVSGELKITIFKEWCCYENAQKFIKEKNPLLRNEENLLIHNNYKKQEFFIEANNLNFFC